MVSQLTMKIDKAKFLNLILQLRGVLDGNPFPHGVYIYKGHRVQISKSGESPTQRVKSLYWRRRENGQCIACGQKVKKYNKLTGKKYRLCDTHRFKIDKQQR